MDILGVKYDKFDEKSQSQLYIDKQSFAVPSEKHESSSEELLQGSIQSLDDSHGIKVKQMCEVLEKPTNRRS